MRLTDDIEVLELTQGFGGIYPVVFGEKDGFALVDACFPGQYDSLVSAVEQSGRRIADVSAVVLTHQDIDHIGCLPEILAAGNDVRLYAHVEEAPYIDGRETPLKLAALERNLDALDPEQEAFYPQLKTGLESRRFPIDHPLRDNDVLPWSGGVRVLHTPGHTHGHIALFAESAGVLVTGDALVLIDGELAGPRPEHAYDLAQAYRSLERFLPLEIETVVCYHGGVYRGDVQAALKRIISSYGR
jgi:glyoxylase-like metal-dependent hydrolase (beta-lactamase superfamily II)